MIIRILGEGQFRVGDEVVDELNASDDRIQAAIEADDEHALGEALTALLETIRRGTPLADDDLSDSDLIVPDESATVSQVRAMLDESGSTDGLIPG